MSTHLERLIVGVLIVLQIGLPGGGETFLCIFGKKYIFPGLGSSIIRRSDKSSSITLITYIYIYIYIYVASESSMILSILLPTQFRREFRLQASSDDAPG